MTLTDFAARPFSTEHVYTDQITFHRPHSLQSQLKQLSMVLHDMLFKKCLAGLTWATSYWMKPDHVVTTLNVLNDKFLKQNAEPPSLNANHIQ